jgi:hypothetical protein
MTEIFFLGLSDKGFKSATHRNVKKAQFLPLSVTGFVEAVATDSTRIAFPVGD